MLQTYKWAGIDYSMSCPALHMSNNPLDFESGISYFLIDSNKFIGTFKNIVGIKSESYDSDENRFDNISNIFLDLLIKHKVEFVGIEGYSFGSSKGLVFNIAENTGLLKHKLWKNNIPFSVYPPKTIKKFATENGNANKDMMYDSFGVDLKTILSYTKSTVGSPIGDIVDSYYICKYHYIKTKEELDAI